MVFVSIASMALGSFARDRTTNIKRLMAYSSIGHMGFALVGLAAGTVEGAQGVVLYLAIYAGDDASGPCLSFCDEPNGRDVSRSAISQGCREPIQ